MKPIAHRVTRIVILLCSVAFSAEVTLVGLSGSESKVSSLSVKEESTVAPLEIWKRFYLNNAHKGDTLVCEYEGKRLYLIKGKKSAFIDGASYTLTHPLKKSKKQWYLNAGDFATLMSDLAYNLQFTFEEESNKLVVSRPQPAEKDAEGIAQEPKVVPKEGRAVSEVEIPAAEQAPSTPQFLVEGSAVATTNSTSKASVAPPKENSYRKLSWKELTGVIVLDPGHGGKDPGAIGPDSTTEKEVVLAISLIAKSFIERNSGVSALLTRDDDTFIPLRGRTKFANSKEARLFVSIHANATEDGVDKGYKMYFLSDSKNESDSRTALLENASLAFEDEDEETDMVHSILLDMMSSEYLAESQELSIEFAKTFSKRLTTKKLHTGIGQANFYVLHGASMPAVLVETAFISNKKEEKLLRDPTFQRTIGDAIGRAVLNFLQQMSINHE